MNRLNLSHRRIELLAYQLWQNRGCPWGTPETDWFEAERELTGNDPETALMDLAREVGTALGTVAALLGAKEPAQRDHAH